MNANLIHDLNKILTILFVFFFQFIFSQSKITDETLLSMVDRHLKSPIKEIITPNGDLYLQREMSSIFESVTFFFIEKIYGATYF